MFLLLLLCFKVKIAVEMFSRDAFGAAERRNYCSLLILFFILLLLSVLDSANPSLPLRESVPTTPRIRPYHSANPSLVLKPLKIRGLIRFHSAKPLLSLRLTVFSFFCVFSAEKRSSGKGMT